MPKYVQYWMLGIGTVEGLTEDDIVAFNPRSHGLAWDLVVLISRGGCRRTLYASKSLSANSTITMERS